MGARGEKVETIRTTVTIEESETWMVRRRRFFTRRFCPTCGREVCMVPPDEAALLACRDVRSIYSFIEKDSFHVIYMEGVKPLICLISLCSI
jgi:hypothetical protein